MTNPHFVLSAWSSLLMAAVTGIFLSSGSAAVLAQNGGLEVGDPAPLFTAQEAGGGSWSLQDHVGESIIVVYFYPAAMTGGCTAQACAFRDHKTQLDELGAEVVGISGDEVAGLSVFRAAHNLNFPLLSDADGEIAARFGVPTGEGGSITRDVDGEEVELERGVTTSRWTYVIGLDGHIKYKNTEVNPERDSEDVISFIRDMTASQG